VRTPFRMTGNAYPQTQEASGHAGQENMRTRASQKTTTQYVESKRRHACRVASTVVLSRHVLHVEEQRRMVLVQCGRSQCTRAKKEAGRAWQVHKRVGC
jgi:hypothetical protein